MELVSREIYLNGIAAFLDYYLKKEYSLENLDSKFFDWVKDDMYCIFRDIRNDFLDVLQQTIPYDEFKHIGYFPKPKPSTFIKLYMASKAYVENFHDIDNYKAILEDISSFDDYNYVYDFDSKFKMNKHTIDAFVGHKYYKSIPNLRRLFSKLYDCFNWTSGSYNFDLDYRKINSVIKDGKDLGIDKDRYLDIANKVIEESGPLFVHSRPYLYSKLLMPGKRFEYINDKLNEIERNCFIRQNIFSYISELDLNMFNEFKDEEKDFFITCMDIVFDSDSYQELSNKLNIIREASYLYGKKEKKQAMVLIGSLTDLSNKKIYCGELVSYPTNCVNFVQKPKTILEREMALYKNINSDFSYEFMMGIHYNMTTLGQMIEFTDKRLNKELSPINTYKRKIKSKFEKMKGNK